MIKAGQNVPGGTDLKKGFEYASGLSAMYAACPMYAINRQGYARPSQEICIARFEKAPRSAKSASTPVKARSIPPSDFHPSVLLRTKYRPAKYGENAFNTE